MSVSARVIWSQGDVLKLLGAGENWPLKGRPVSTNVSGVPPGMSVELSVAVIVRPDFTNPGTVAGGAADGLNVISWISRLLISWTVYAEFTANKPFPESAFMAIVPPVKVLFVGPVPSNTRVQR